MSANPNSLYPQVIQTNPDATYPPSSSSSMYPSVDVNHLAEDLFPETDAVSENTQNLQSSEEVLVKAPGAIVHLIEKHYSIELACGELAIVGLRQGGNVVAVLARFSDEIQWPLAKDEAAVKLDHSHYFFNLRVPDASSEKGEMELLNYGLTIASKGQDGLMKELDRVLETYSCFSEQKMKGLEHWDRLSIETSGSESEEVAGSRYEVRGLNGGKLSPAPPQTIICRQKACLRRTDNFEPHWERKTVELPKSLEDWVSLATLKFLSLPFSLWLTFAIVSHVISFPNLKFILLGAQGVCKDLWNKLLQRYPGRFTTDWYGKKFAEFRDTLFDFGKQLEKYMPKKLVEFLGRFNISPHEFLASAGWFITFIILSILLEMGKHVFAISFFEFVRMVYNEWITSFLAAVRRFISFRG